MKRGKFFQTLWKYRWHYLAGLVMLYVVDYLSLYISEYVGDVTDGLQSHTLDASGVGEYALRIALCALFIAIGRFFWRRFIIGASKGIQRLLRNSLFEKLETLSQSYFNEHKTGDIMAYFTNDLDSLYDALGRGVISAFDGVVLTIMTLYKMMTNVSVTLTLITLIPMIGLCIVGFLLEGAFEKSFYVRQEAFGKLTDAVQETVSAERVIKAFVQEDAELEEFKKINNHNREVNMKIARLRSTAWPIMEVLIGSAYVIAIAVGGYYCLTGDITLGNFVTFASYVNTLVWPMLAIGDTITMLSQARAGVRRINEVYNEISDIQDDPCPDDVAQLVGGVDFDHVSFRYADDLPLALDDVSFTIQPGETFAIMGKTGTGKSTIVNLMTRMFDVDGGCISFDGHDIRKIPLNTLHENIAYVPQDNFLFSETLQENISFGKTDATMDEIVEACKMADIHDNISDFPDKYQTMVGERGVTLSGGQKQRSSIARALLKDSPILIMDDSLSAVDTDTEDTILHNLRRLRRGKTTIMIAHRVSTVQAADHILVLDDGKVAEYGNYEELMEKDGIFAQMAKKQQLEKQLAATE